MKCSEHSMLLYAVTGGSSPLPLTEQVRQAIAGGITFLQLRIKHSSTKQLVREADNLIPLCRAAGIPFVIDDDVEAAKMCGADGVHVGQSDSSLAEARRILGPGKIIGVSAHTVEEAKAAEQGGADYLGVGAMFATATKTDAELVSLETLRDICNAVHIPVVAIGGINLENLDVFRNSGANGAAIVSAIFSSGKIQESTAALRKKAESVFEDTPSMRAWKRFTQVPKSCNCAQAVVYGLGREDLWDAMSACGGGRAPEGLCGALYAALSLIPEEKRESVKQQFSAKAGGLCCREIRPAGVFPCAECVLLAAKLAGH